MRIKSFRITNYKSFEDSGVHELAPHMNVIVGQNNVGKTALLQAIAQQIQYKPHRNSRQARGQALSQFSQIDFDFICSGAEARNVVMLSGGATIPFPSQMVANYETFFQLSEITVSAALRSGPGTGWVSRFPSNNLTSVADIVRLLPNEQRTSFSIAEQHGVSAANQDNFGSVIGQRLQRRTYLFNALRSPFARSPAGSNAVLKPNAENLPEVLATFQPNTTSYKRFIEQVRRVLPLVKWVDVVPTGGETEIRAWNVDEETGRDDLPNSIVECGTGIGQVLAILYVVTRSQGDIICIDEPNSFLHPGAAKALMAILNEHKEHQYIIATHSPEIIVSSHAERLFMLRFENEQTVIRELDRSDVDSARRMLEEIGSRFSDIFGTEAVIWVEGPTEEECFPLLLEAQGIRLPAGEGGCGLSKLLDDYRLRWQAMSRAQFVLDGFYEEQV